MPAGRKKTHIVSGLHIVRKALNHGDRYYVYAWRGGPCIHTQDDKYPVVTPVILAKQQKAKSDQYGRTSEGFEQIIRGYRNSPEYASKEASTRYEYDRWLTRISERFGKAPVGAFEDREMRKDIIEWRNQWQDQPRTADIAAVMMSMLLNWAVENGILKVNVAAKIKNLHHVNRADLIWEDRHWQAINDAKLPTHLMDALKVSSWTGLRLGDLVKLDWSEVGPKAIIRITNKRKSRAVIPIMPPLRAWLDAVPVEKRTGAVLKNSRGYGWSSSGLGTVFQRSKPEGFDRTIHDLRGTFCTMLILKSLTDDQAAMIMGWTAKRVSEIRSRYVDEERIIISLAEKMSA